MAKIAELKTYRIRILFRKLHRRGLQVLSDKVHQLPESYMPRKPLAARQCRKKPLLLFGIHQKRGKQMRVHIHLGCQVLH